MIKANMQKLEDEKIYKYCGFIDHVQTWIRTHAKFLRAGDRFKIGDEIFLATGDPYWNQPPMIKPTVENIAKGLYDPRDPPIEQEPGWTIKFVKE